MKKAFIDDSDFRHYIFGELMKRAKMEEEVKQFTSYEDFIAQLFGGVYFEEWSLDHDLGTSSMDGTAALVLLFGNKNHDGILPKAMYPKWICIHSHNDTGSWRMYNLIPDSIPTTVSRFDYSGWERPKGMKVNGPTQYNPDQAPRAFHSSEEAKERSAVQRGYFVSGCNQPLSTGSYSSYGGNSYGGTSYQAGSSQSSGYSKPGYWDAKAGKWIDTSKETDQPIYPSKSNTEKIGYQQLPLGTSTEKRPDLVKEKHGLGDDAAGWRQVDAVRWEMLQWMENPDDPVACAKQTEEIKKTLPRYRVYSKDIPDSKMKIYTYVDADKHEAFDTQQTSLTDADNAFSKFLYDEEDELRKELKEQELKEDAEACGLSPAEDVKEWNEEGAPLESEQTPSEKQEEILAQIAARNQEDIAEEAWSRFCEEHGQGESQDKPAEKDGNTLLL